MTELETNFLCAVYDGNIEEVKECIQAGVDINVQYEHCENTALLTAATLNCGGKSVKLIKLLLDVGADIKTTNCFRKTALESAEERIRQIDGQEKLRKIEIINLLKDFGKSIQEFDDCRFLS